MIKPQPLHRQSRPQNTTAIRMLISAGLINVDTTTGTINGKKGDPLKEQLNFFGYRKVTPKLKGKTISVYVHKAVWIASGQTIPQNHEIDHIDKDKQNCSLSNLRTIPWTLNMARTSKQFNEPERAF